MPGDDGRAEAPGPGGPSWAPPVPVGEWAAPAGQGTPSWVWALVGVVGMVLLSVLAATAVSIFLDVRERASQANRIGVGQPGLVAPESVAGLRRNRSPQAERLAATVVGQGRANGVPDVVAAAYGPDSQSRLLVVTAIRNSAEDTRRAFTRDASRGLADSGGVTVTSSAGAEITRGDTAFRCTSFGPVRAANAFCTWDDGDVAGLGLGTGMSSNRLAGLLATARAKIGQ
jgi:hypothetical protein